MTAPRTDARVPGGAQGTSAQPASWPRQLCFGESHLDNSRGSGDRLQVTNRRKGKPKAVFVADQRKADVIDVQIGVEDTLACAPREPAGAPRLAP